MALPFLWDIMSILSILVLHFKSFRSTYTGAPKAGHYNESGGVPTLENASTVNDDVSAGLSSSGSFL